MPGFWLPYASHQWKRAPEWKHEPKIFFLQTISDRVGGYNNVRAEPSRHRCCSQIPHQIGDVNTYIGSQYKTQKSNLSWSRSISFKISFTANTRLISNRKHGHWGPLLTANRTVLQHYVPAILASLSRERIKMLIIAWKQTDSLEVLFCCHQTSHRREILFLRFANWGSRSSRIISCNACTVWSSEGAIFRLVSAIKSKARDDTPSRKEIAFYEHRANDQYEITLPKCDNGHTWASSSLSDLKHLVSDTCISLSSTKSHSSAYCVVGKLWAKSLNLKASVLDFWGYQWKTWVVIDSI